MMLFKQCRLKEFGGNRETVAWIEERAAKKGCQVQVKEFQNHWFWVEEVYIGTLSEGQLRTKQAMDRDCFGSLTGKK